MHARRRAMKRKLRRMAPVYRPEVMTPSARATSRGAAPGAAHEEVGF